MSISNAISAQQSSDSQKQGVLQQSIANDADATIKDDSGVVYGEQPEADDGALRSLSGSSSAPRLMYVLDYNGPTYVSGTISSDTTWTVDASPYVLSGTVTVASSAHLYVEPGAVVKASSSRAINVLGTLAAEGTSEDPIVFTSLKDDSIAGDTDNTTATPAAGDWAGVRFSGSGADASRLSHAEIRYAGASNQIGGSGTYYRAGLVVVNSADPAVLSHIDIDQASTYGVYLYNGSPTLDHIGQSGSTNGLYVVSGAPTVTDSSFESNSYGVYVYGDAAPSLEGLILNGNTTFPLWLSSQATPELSDISGNGNAKDAISLSGTRSSATLLTLPALDLPYTGSFTISSGAQVTVEPGAVFKNSSSNAINVLGTLAAEGTSEDPIVFTSLKDDSIAGDTDNTTATPAAGDWAGVRFSGSGADASRLSHAEIRYAGASARIGTSGTYYTAGLVVANDADPAVLSHLDIDRTTGYGIYTDCSSSFDHVTQTYSSDGLRVISGSPEITDSSFANNTSNGVYVYGTSAPVLSDLTLSENGNYPLYLGADSAPTLDDISGNGNGKDVVYLAGGWTITRGSSTPLHLVNLPTFPYYGWFGAQSATTVVIEPGTVLKMMKFTVRGQLIAEGTADEPIRFTSIKDDSIGGDSDNQEQTPAAGDWVGVRLDDATASSSSLRYVEITYAGAFDDGGDISGTAGGWHSSGMSLSDGAQPNEVSYVTINQVTGYGIRLSSVSPVLDHIEQSNASGSGLYTYAGTPTIKNSVFRGNNTGIYVYASSPTINRTTIKANASAGLDVSGASTVTANYNDLYDNGAGGQINLNADSGNVIDARYNYWGRREGPRAEEMLKASCTPWLWYSFKTPDSAQVLGGNTACGRYGEPVNTATGNFYYSATDLTLSGTGPTLSLSRTYNHQDADTKSPIGNGWNLDFESFIQPDGDDLVVTYPGGTRKTFADDGAGGYEAPSGTFETLTQRVDGSFDLTFTDGSISHYASQGWLESVTDRYGNALTYDRTSAGRLTKVNAPGGRYLEFTYTGDLITSATDSASRTVSYAYDATDNLTGVTDVNGETTTFTYDASSRVTAVAAPLHPATPFVRQTYDADNRVDQQWDGFDSAMTFDYGETLTTILNNRGKTVVHERDEEQRLVGETDGAGDTVTYRYNAAGLKDQMTDARSNTWSYGYDANGNLTSATDPLTHRTRASYDASSNVQWTEDALGNRTTYTWDVSKTFLTRVESPETTIDYDYYANGLVHHMVSADATTTFAYDADGNLTSLIDPLGFESTFEYSGAGFLTAATDAEDRCTEMDYDAAGNVTRIEDALGNEVTLDYDANGNRTETTDALDNTTEFSFDVMDQLSGVTDALGNETAYTYDPNYNLASVTNARDFTTEYTYSDDDQLTGVEDALGREWSLSYDAAGNLTSTAYPDGHGVSRTYDAANRLTSMASNDDSLAYDYTYRADDSLDTVEDQDGSTWDYGYDAEGRITSTEDDIAGTDAFTVTRDYDDAGYVSQVQLSGGPTRTFDYDLAGRLTTLTPSATSTQSVTFGYDNSGLITSKVTPDGSYTSFDYDAAGRLESIAATMPSGVLSFSYERDANGRITEQNGERYAYDAAGRLTSWYDPSADATTTYAYDAAFNVTGVSVDGSQTAHFTFDAADRISSVGYAYDLNGNLTARPGQTLAYDALNRLSAVIDASTDTTIAAYTYDHLNRRTSATDTSGTVYFHYDGTSSDVVAETDANGDTIATYLRDASGRLVAMERDGERYYYHTDARGDVVALTDGTGDVVNSYAYDPYGTITDATETVDNPYRYASYRYDAATGLYYLWNRYYDPASMRFITKDIYPGELTSPASMNGYAYCLGDPVNAVDPSGFMNVAGGGGGIAGTRGWSSIASVKAWQQGNTVGILSLVAGGVSNGWMLKESLPVDRARGMRSCEQLQTARNNQRQLFIPNGQNLTGVGIGSGRAPFPVSMNVWSRSGWAEPDIVVGGSLYFGTGVDATIISSQGASTAPGIGSPFAWFGIQGWFNSY